MYKIKFYPTRKGGYPAKDFIQQMDKKSRAKIWRYIALLEEHGPNLLRPYADYVRDKEKHGRFYSTISSRRI